MYAIECIGALQVAVSSLLQETLTWLSLLGTGIAMAGVPVLTQAPFLFKGADWTHTRAVGVGMCIAAAVFVGCKLAGKTAALELGQIKAAGSDLSL